MICLFSTGVQAGLFTSKDSVDVEEYEGQFLLIDHNNLKVVMKDFDTIGAIDSKKLEVYMDLGFKNDKVFRFKSREQFQTWLNSVFPDYQCLTDNGIEECK